MLINEILNCAKKMGFDKQEVTVIQDKNIIVELSALLEETVISSNVSFFVFRGMLNNKYVMFHSENCDIDSLYDQIKEASETEGLSIEMLTPAVVQFNDSNLVKSTTMYVPQKSKEHLLKKAKELYNSVQIIFETLKNGKNDKVFVEQCRVGTLQNNICTKNNSGFLYKQKKNYYYAFLSLKLKVDESVHCVSDFQYCERFSDLEIETFVSKLLLSLLAKSKAKALNVSGMYTVVFSNKVTAHLLEAFCPIFFEANIKSGHSCLKNKFNYQIANPIINIVDSGHCEYTSHTVEYDFEGTPVTEKTIIRNGFFVDCLQESIHLDLGQKAAGGNVFLYEDTIGTNISNFYIRPSSVSFEELINIDYGLLITEISDLKGIVSFSTGDISATISGFEIVSGKIGNAFENRILNSNICDILKKATSLDCNMFFTIPNNCGSVGAPNVRLKDICIS